MFFGALLSSLSLSLSRKRERGLRTRHPSSFAPELFTTSAQRLISLVTKLP